MKTDFISVILKFSKSQRLGLLILFSLILLMQLVIWFGFRTTEMPQENQVWTNLPPKIDSAQSSFSEYRPKPFNPNFISDYKGYMLGMSVAQIDRLLAYRKTGKYVNSALEFQQVTQVSDEQLQKLEPYFKFPDWVHNKPSNIFTEKKVLKKESLIDINTATADDLKKIYGIGDGYAQRILTLRQKLGGFVHINQIEDVWGLSPDVIAALKQRFVVVNQPIIRKININKAGIKELMQLPYFRYPLAKAIVVQRSMNGSYKNIEDLTKISDFPVDKIEIIALYLDF
ncbi:helix-hairpin-helix domain-containing protein [Flavobacterium sp. CYK-55]|nr:helix-hairpin-helix domain-containing protein [Flavobacterium sp. CYK-55]